MDSGENQVKCKDDNEDRKMEAAAGSNSSSPTHAMNPTPTKNPTHSSVSGSNHKVLAKLLVDEILSSLRDQTVVRSVVNEYKLEMKKHKKSTGETGADTEFCCRCCVGLAHLPTDDGSANDDGMCCCCCSKDVERIKSLLDGIKDDDDKVEKELRARIECLTQSNAELKKSRISTQCELECERKEKSKMSEQMACMQKKLTSATFDLQKSQLVEKELKATIESLKEANAELKESLTTWRCATEREGKENSRLKEHINCLNGRLNNSTSTSQKSQQFTKKVEQELENTKQELSEEQGRLELCNKRLCESNNKIEQLNSSYAAVKCANKELRQAVADKTETIDKLLCEKNDLCRQIDSLKERVQATEHCQLLEKDLCSLASSEEAKARHDAETYEEMWRAELEAKLGLAKQVGHLKQCYTETKNRNEMLCRKLNRLQLVKKHLDARVGRSKQKILEQQRRVNKYMGDMSINMSNKQQQDMLKKKQLLQQKKILCREKRLQQRQWQQFQQQRAENCHQGLGEHGQNCHQGLGAWGQNTHKEQRQEGAKCQRQQEGKSPHLQGQGLPGPWQTGLKGQQGQVQGLRQRQGHRKQSPCQQTDEDEGDHSDCCYSYSCSICGGTEESADEDSDAEQSTAQRSRDSSTIQCLRKQLESVQSELEKVEQKFLEEQMCRWKFEKQSRHLTNEIERLKTVECEVEKLEHRIKDLLAERQRHVPRERLERELEELEERSKCELDRSTAKLSSALIRHQEQLEQLRRENERQLCELRVEHEKHIKQLQNRLANQTSLYESEANEKSELLEEVKRYKRLYTEQVEIRERLVESLGEMGSFSDYTRDTGSSPGNTSAVLDNTAAAAPVATSTPKPSRPQTDCGCKEREQEQSYDMGCLRQRLRQAIDSCVHGKDTRTPVDQTRSRSVQNERSGKKDCSRDCPTVYSHKHQKYINLMQQRYCL